MIRSSLVLWFVTTLVQKTRLFPWCTDARLRTVYGHPTADSTAQDKYDRRSRCPSSSRPEGRLSFLRLGIPVSRL